MAATKIAKLLPGVEKNDNKLTRKVNVTENSLCLLHFLFVKIALNFSFEFYE